METEVLEGVKSTGGKTETSRAQRYLENNIGKLDAETQKAIKAGSMQFYDADYYIRTEILAGTTIILDSQNKKAVGVSNLDENKLAAMVYLVVEKVRLAYGTHATETNPAAIGYSNTGGTFPIAVLNGELVVRVDDKPIVELPVARFFNNSSTGISNAIQGFNDVVSLGALRMIGPANSITIELVLPKTLGLGSGKHFIEVRMMGATTRRR